MNRQIKQIALPLIAAAIWGSAFLVQGNLGDYLPPFFINAARGIVAFIALFVLDRIMWLLRKNKTAQSVSSVEKIDVKKLLIGGLICGVFLFGAINVQQIGINGTTSGEAAFITTLYMLLVPIFGVFLKKKIGLNIWASVILGVVGLALICELQSFSINVYYIYLLISAVFFALQIMAVDYFVQFVDGVKLSCVQFLVASVLSGVISLIFEEVDGASLAKGILPILYLGIFSSAGGYTLQIISQKGTNAAVVTLLLSMESVFALIFGILACLASGRPIEETPLQLIGCAIMFAAVIVSQFDFNFAKSGKNSAQ